MNLPNIPSDNIYKFIALSALVLLVISIYYLKSTEQDLNIGMIELISELEILNMDHEKTIEAGNKIVNNLTLFTQVVNFDSVEHILSEESYQKFLIEFDKSKVEKKTSQDNVTTISKILPPSANKKIFEKQLMEFEKLFNISKLYSIKINKKDKILDEKIRQRDSLKSIFDFSLYPLIIIMLVGFYLWYIKVQRYQDMILKNQAQHLNKEKE